MKIDMLHYLFNGYQVLGSWLMIPVFLRKCLPMIYITYQKLFV